MAAGAASSAYTAAGSNARETRPRPPPCSKRCARRPARTLRRARLRRGRARARAKRAPTARTRARPSASNGRAAPSAAARRRTRSPRESRRRSEWSSRPRSRRRAAAPRAAARGLEIDQHGRAVRDQDVLAVQVAMHPARVVERAHERADRGEQRPAPRGVRERVRRAASPSIHSVTTTCSPDASRTWASGAGTGTPGGAQPHERAPLALRGAEPEPRLPRVAPGVAVAREVVLRETRAPVRERHAREPAALLAAAQPLDAVVALEPRDRRPISARSEASPASHSPLRSRSAVRRRWRQARGSRRRAAIATISDSGREARGVAARCVAAAGRTRRRDRSRRRRAEGPGSSPRMRPPTPIEARRSRRSHRPVTGENSFVTRRYSLEPNRHRSRAARAAALQRRPGSYSTPPPRRNPRTPASVSTREISDPMIEATQPLEALRGHRRGRRGLVLGGAR